nr:MULTISPECIES: aminomethyl-transferring glycine dehydrogenase subunit GcvPA [unclassified Brevibacterium]
MSVPSTPVHPYIPNSAAGVKREMLDAIGVDSVEDLLSVIPEKLRRDRDLDLPPALVAESDLDRHMTRVLGANRPAADAISFLGSGTYHHYVPAVCSEVNSRAEFLTAYAGEAYEDHGKWQAIFEYTSLMADLLEMDVVNVPTYDGYQALATALRMAVRITGRSRVLVPATLEAAKRERIDAFLAGVAQPVTVPCDPESGTLDTGFITAQLDDTVAAVLVETPNYRGCIETDAPDIARSAHAAGALLVCATDPISLGYLPAPASWGADIVCGDIQSLGLGMHFGGANGGFIATHDDERFVYEFPSRLFGLASTRVDGELGFVDVAYERTSLAMRDQGVEWVGTAAALWGITAAVYLAQLGPAGMAELGRTIAANTRFAITRIEQVPGVRVVDAGHPHWREFLIEYAGHDAVEVNAALLAAGIHGGAPAPEVFGPAAAENQAVFCVTEQTTADDLAALTDILR